MENVALAQSHFNENYNGWYWLNASTGEVGDFNCASWSCPRCAPKLAYKWAVVVANAHPDRMVTLTNVPYNRQEAYLAYSHLIQDIRRQGWRIDYARFLEVGEKGMLHWHLAQKGDFLPHRWLSAHAEKAGLGSVNDIRRCYGAGVGFYLGKYVTKDAPLLGWRKVSTSRGFPRLEKALSSDEWLLVRSPDLDTQHHM
jgi:hypothetical protein